MSSLGVTGRGLRVGIGLSVLACAGLGLCDGGYALHSAAESFDSAGEAWWFGALVVAATLLPAVLLGLIEGIVGGLLGSAARALATSTSTTRTAPWLGRLGALLAAPAVVSVCAQIFRGPRAQRIPGRDAIAVGLGVACLFLLSLGIVWTLRLVCWVDESGPHRRRNSAAIGLLLCLVCCGLYLADRQVLPRLYPWFHLSLFVLTLGFAQLAALFLILGRGHLRRRWLNDEFFMVALTLALIIVGGLSLSRLTRALTFRGIALEHTGFMSRVLALHARAAGPQPQTPSADQNGHPGAPRSALPSAGLPQRAPRLPDSDVYLITVDALRYDLVRPQTMPVTAALGATGVVFDRAYTQVPHTSFAVATLLTGKPVYALLTMGQDAADHQTLPTILRGARFKTAAFFPPSVFFIEHERLKKLEESAYGFEYVKYEYLAAPQRTDQVIHFLETEHPAHAFVWVHYLEPHEPYDAHPGGPGPRASDRERYDGEARFVDQEIARLLDYVRQHRKGALVILAADHGEEFGEHGGRYHGTTLYEEQVHVPLFLADLSVPSRLPARHIAEPVGLIDVAPTLLGLLDIPPSARMRGHDLGPYLPDGARLPLWPVFAEIGRKMMVVLDHDKLICDMSTDACALYDLAHDPAERKNRIEADPERARALRDRLSGFVLEASRFERGSGSAQAVSAEIEQVLLRGRAGDRAAAADLARLVGAPDIAPQVRREATAHLAEICVAAAQQTSETTAKLDPAAPRAAFLAAQAVPDAETRSWAAVGRLAQGDADVLPAVVSTIKDVAANDRLRLVAALALAARAEVPSGEAVPLLLDVLPLGMAMDDPDRVRPLLLALGRSQDPRAFDPLVQQLAAVRSRTDVVVALGLLGQRKATATLAELLLHDPYVPVRAAAATALGRLGGPAALDALEQAGKSEGEGPVVTALRAARRQLGPPANRR